MTATVPAHSLRSPEDKLEELFTLLSSADRYDYCSGVTILEHSLQCADLAQLARASDDVLIAALLHDVGMLLPGPDHAEVGAILLRDLGFPQRVIALVGGHCDRANAASREMQQLARWDEQARRLRWRTPGLESYRDVLLRVLRIGGSSPR